MKPRQQVSRAALELIKTFEGYRRNAAQLPDGRWTIGFGHTLTAREGAEVSREDAEALLLYDLIGVSHAVNEQVFTTLTQNQFDGLACFAFSIGVDNFKKSSVLRRVNEGQLLQAAYDMEMWRRSDFEGERIVIDVLVRRRAAEKTLFLTPQAGWAPAPSPILPPKVDYEIEHLAPRQNPTAVRALMDGPLAVAEREEGERPAADPSAPTAAEQAAAAVAAKLEAIEPRVEPAEAPEPVDLAPAEVAPVEPAVEDAVVETLAEPEAPVVEAEPEVEAEPTPPEVIVETPATLAEPEPAALPPVRAESWTTPTLTASDQAFSLSAAEPSPEPVVEPPPAEEEPAAPQPGPSLFDLSRLDFSAVQPKDEAEKGGRRPSSLIDSFDPAFSMQRADPAGFSGLPLVGLALLGLVVFAGGVFWGLNAAPDPSGGVPVAKTLGWMLGVLGVICFGVAAYGLLRKLGGDDEDGE